MRAILCFTVLMIFPFQAIAQNNQLISNVPNLEITGVDLEDENGNRIIDSNEISTLHLLLKNTGGMDAGSVKVRLNMVAPADLPLKYRKQRTIPALKAGMEADLEFIIASGEMIPDGLVEFQIEIQEENGFNAFPSKLRLETGQQTRTTLAETDSPADSVPRMRGGGDPLKGLGYEEAVSELKVGRYFALLIGIDRYTGSWVPLENAVNDARALQEVLTSEYEFHTIRTLYNDQATKDNIINEFLWLSRNITPEDNVLIYYSGHGEFREDMNIGFWVPYGVEKRNVFDYIENTTIRNLIYGIRSKHTLLISDACFSGDVFRISRGEAITRSFDRGPQYYQNVYQKDSRKALTPGIVERKNESGIEGHSVFSYYLLKVLENNEANMFDASQLFDELKSPVYDSSQQFPRYDAINNTGDAGGQFVFIRK